MASRTINDPINLPAAPFVLPDLEARVIAANQGAGSAGDRYTAVLAAVLAAKDYAATWKPGGGGTPTPTPSPTLPGAPSITVTPGNARNTIDVTPGSAGSKPTTSYRIYRDGASLTTIAGTQLVDPGLVNGQAYSYRAAGISADGEGAPSAARSGTPVAPAATLPGAPTIAVAGGDAQATITITAGSAGTNPTAAYRIYRDGEMVRQQNVADGLVWTDTGLTNGTPYAYRASAVSSDGEGPPSAASIVTPAGGGTIAPGYRTDVLDDGGGSAVWYGQNAGPVFLRDPQRKRVIGVAQLFQYNSGTPRKVNTALLWDEVTQVATLGGDIMEDIGTIVGSADHHGVGSLCWDHYGFLHSYGGGHNNPMKHSVSLDGGVTWRQDPAIGDGLTYSHPFHIGTTQYMIARQSGNGNYPLVIYRSTAINSATGAITWGGEVKIVDLGADTRVYAGNVQVIGNLVYVPFCRANAADSVRRDFYIMVIDVTNPAAIVIRNLAGDVTIPFGTAMTRAQAEASFRLVDTTTSGTEEGNTPAIWIDDEGIHGLVQAGASGLTYRYFRWSMTGQQQEMADIGTAPYRYATPAIGRMAGSAGGVQVIFPVPDNDVLDMDTNAVFTRGGSIYRRQRPKGGAWSAAALVKRVTPVHPFDACTLVKDGTDAFLFAFGERAIDDSDFATGGNLHSYGVTAAGQMVTTTRPLQDVTKAMIGSESYSDEDAFILDMTVRGAARSGLRERANFAHPFAEPVAAVSLKCLLGTTVLASVVGTGVVHTPYKGWDAGTAGKLANNFNPLAAGSKMTTASIQLGVIPNENVSAASSDIGTSAATASLTLGTQSTSGNASSLLASTGSNSVSRAIGRADLITISQRVGARGDLYFRSKTDGNNTGQNVAVASLPNATMTFLGNGTGYSQRGLSWVHGGSALDVGPVFQVMKRYRWQRVLSKAA